jgi:hypothetical protein
MKDMRRPGKRSKSALKKITATAVFAGSLLASTPAAKAEAEPKGEALYRRVQVVREALTKGLAESEAKASDLEVELAQWGNWGNWGNWANWANWNNWNNWGNWGNWRNY